ncbi:hypothetical protein [Myxosarcina sp. GI1(2024)]
MSQSSQNSLNSKVIEKTISASIKKEISAASINNATRKGNKELKFLIGQIAKYPFDNLEQAEMAGANLGKYIAEASQKSGKQNLDAGIIHQMRYQGELFSLAGLSEVKPQPEDRAAPVDSTATTSNTSESSTREVLPSVSQVRSPEVTKSQLDSAGEDVSASERERQVEQTPELPASDEKVAAPEVDVGQAASPSPAPEVDLTSEIQTNDETVPASEVDLTSETQPNDEEIPTSEASSMNTPEVAEDSQETASVPEPAEEDKVNTEESTPQSQSS